MSTTNYELTGKVNWAKLREELKDTRFNKEGTYNIDFYPQSQRTWDIIERSGLQLKHSTSEDGEFLRIRRNHQGLVKGDLVTWGPPKVFLNGENFTGNIGNGSLVSINISVYDSVKGKGHRLNSVNVLELVEYEGGVKTISDQEEEFENESPAPTAKTKSRAKKALMPF